jgi:asparagine synthase (glutamine-hydrolysing)
MRRLSIIDLDTGHQPIHNEDETIWVVFNGEIYNFKELRKRLEERGHKFYTSSDSECIVHCYEEYGERCFEHLLGMFAIAIWDSINNILLFSPVPYVSN